MNWLLETVLQPWTEPFMRRALLVAVVAAVVCATVGVYVVLRGMAFIGDAVSHSVFPGVAAAYLLDLPLVAGGAAAGVATAVVVAVVARNRRLGEDAVIGVLFAFAFGLGIVLVSSQRGYSGDLASFLFGQVLAVSETDVLWVSAVGALVVLLAVGLRRELTALCLDRETASVCGLPVFRLELALYLMVTVAIVISLEAVGNILVLALLVTPAATARLLTDRLGVMMALAAGLGAAGALLGLYLSYQLRLAAGGMIVTVLTGFFVLAWLVARRGPRGG